MPARHILTDPADGSSPSMREQAQAIPQAIAGVRITHYPYSTDYTGTAAALIPANIARADQLPGSPGMAAAV